MARETSVFSASIILPTVNRDEHLRQALASLAGVHVPEGWDVDLLVVDNGSTDNTEEIVRSSVLPRMAVRYLRVTRPGKSIALNAALAATSGEAVILTDDDIRFPERWLEAMCEPILSGRGMAVFGCICPPDHLKSLLTSDLLRSCFSVCDWWDWDRPRMMIGANMAISRKILEKVPAFEPELGPGALGLLEDTLFSYQVEAAGFTIVNAGRDSLVEHHFDPSRLRRPPLLQKAELEGRSLAFLYYHWLHSRMKFPALRQAVHTARLAALRLLRQPGRRGEFDCPEWELRLLIKIAFCRRFRQERRRPRLYDHRALVRRVPDSVTVGETGRTGRAASEQQVAHQTSVGPGDN